MVSKFSIVLTIVQAETGAPIKPVLLQIGVIVGVVGESAESAWRACLRATERLSTCTQSSFDHKWLWRSVLD